MRDLTNKLTGGTLLAPEWNEVPSELQNFIVSSGQALSGGDLTQVSKALAHYAANVNFYTDAGSVNVYELVPIGVNAVAPIYHNGREIEFIVANTNTGTSTINVNTVGIKTITGSVDAGTLTAGTMVRLRYNSGTDEFVIISTSDIIGGIKVDDYIPSIDQAIISRDYVSASVEIFNLGDPGASAGDFSVVDYFVGSGVALHALNGVAVDQQNGDVWVVDTIGTKVRRAANGSTDWQETEDDYSYSSPKSIAVNSQNKDVIVLDLFNDQVRKLTNGAGVWAALENYDVDLAGAHSATCVAINENNGDVWVTDIQSGNENLNQLPTGSGTWINFTYPGTTPISVAVNQSTNDVWVIDSVTHLVYKLASSIGAFTNSGVGSFPGSNAIGITVNSITGEVWVEDGVLGLYHSEDGSDDWVLVVTHNKNINQIAIYDKAGHVYGSVFDQTNEDVLFKAEGKNINWFIKT